MKRLEQLPEITDRALGGLTADEQLRQRILNAAAQAKEQPSNVISFQPNVPVKKRNMTRWAGSLAAAAVLAVVGLSVGLPSVIKQPAEMPANVIDDTSNALEDMEEKAEVVLSSMMEKAIANEPVIEEEMDEFAMDDGIMLVSMAADVHSDVQQEVLADVETLQEDAVLVETRSAGVAENENGQARITADLGNGAITVHAKKNAAGYRSIWEENNNGTFPMVRDGDRYYRLLSVPEDVSSSLFGAKLGAVSSFAAEPALASGGMVSNIAKEGANVYALSGFEGTLVAAEVNGHNRVFQRVSFNGSALRGEEKLADTLRLAGHITGMELTGVGAVTDVNTCERLFSTLTSRAQFESSGAFTANGALLIQLDNGIAVQLDVKDERIAGCGVWNCPEFFEAFRKEVK